MSAAPNTLRERILQAALAALANVARSHGATLLRAPLAPLTREQTPALLLLPDSDRVVSRKNTVVERELAITLAAVARQAGRSGPAPELAADAMLGAAHTALFADTALRALVLGLTETDSDWEQQSFEVTSAVLPARYLIAYRTLAADTTTQA